MSSALDISLSGRPVTRSFAIASVVGVAHAIVVLAVRTAIGLPMDLKFFVWAFVGAIVVGTFFAYLAIERKLYTPAIATLGSFAVAAYFTWRYYASLDGAAPGTFPQPLFMYISLWPLVVAFEGVVAALEQGVRRAVAVLVDLRPL